MATAKTLAKPCTRHHVVNQKFATLLEEDFGIPNVTVLSALDGESKRAAIAICAWAERISEPVGALLAWARKHHARATTATGQPRHSHEGTRHNTPERRRATPPHDGGSVRLSIGAGGT